MLHSLGIGLTGLNAAQRGIETVSHNIANINTPGYTRQRVDQAAAPPTAGIRPVGPGAYGSGVEVLGVRQLRDSLIDNGMRSALGSQGMNEEVTRAMAAIQTVAGTLEDGLATDLAKLWSAWTDVATEPRGITGRAAVIDAGNRFAASLRSASAGIDRLAADSAERLRGTQDQINNLGRSIASLNAQILEVTTAGGTANDLLDQRNVAVEQLAKLTGAQVRPAGEFYDVMIGNSLFVSGTTAQQFTVGGSPPVVSIDGAPVIAGGSVGALANLANNGLGDLRERLDMIANGLRDAMNTAHQAGTDLDGAAGGDFFTGTGARDFAVSSSLTARGIAASTSGSAGDGNNAIAMADVRYAVLVGTPGDPGTPSLSVNDAIADLVSDLGRRAATSQRELDAASAHVVAMEGRRQETSGVSIDEEMTSLLKYQRAYEAAARIVTASDEMLDTLINRLGIVGR